MGAALALVRGPVDSGLYPLFGFPLTSGTAPFQPVLTALPSEGFLLAPPSSLAVTPSQLLFPTTAVGSTSTPLPLTLTNTGTRPFDLTGSTFFGTNKADFLLTNQCQTGYLLPPGQSCTLEIVFAPTNGGTRTAFGEIPPGATTSPIFVTLSGSATGSAPDAQLTISPAAVVFPPTLLTGSSTAAVTLQNSFSTRTIHLLSTTQTGPNGTEYSVGGNCGSQLAPNASCSLFITFSPTGTGTRAATIGLVTTASNSPQTITLTGSGSATKP